MKKIVSSICIVLLAVMGYFAYAQTKSAPKTEAKQGEVIAMNKALFLKEVFNYETSREWKFLGKKPVIIDLYADWCGPCRRVAPIMKELAKEYEGKITIYKVNVDKEKELAALFQANSIPLFVFIPVNGEPRLQAGAGDKASYKKIIEQFLLKK